MKKLCCLQHVPFEGPAHIGHWAETRGFETRPVALYEDMPLPELEALDGVVVMGGPMGANDDLQYPWMKREKHFIQAAIEQEKPVLGICLGAQLIAAVMGAQVYKNDLKEIGWFTVRKTENADSTLPGRALAPHFDAFHWHGDTFDIPAGAVHLAFSEACANQAFAYKDRVLGLQFHLESTRSSVEALLKNCAEELQAAPYIQSAEQIRAELSRIERSNEIMVRLLDTLFK